MSRYRIRSLLSATTVAAIAIALASNSDNLADWWVTNKYQPQKQFNGKLWRDVHRSLKSHSVSERQLMINDLVTNFLPNKSLHEIEIELGESPSHEDMKRYTAADLGTQKRNASGDWEPLQRSGVGFFYDEFEWDLLYYIGKEQYFIYDHRGNAFDPSEEVLFIRLDEQQRFSSWFILGSSRWQNLVSKDAIKRFSNRRATAPKL